MGGLLHHALRVHGQQGVYQEGGGTPDQGLQKPLQREAGVRRVEGYEDDHRRDGGLFDAGLFATQKHGHGHGQGHDEPGLQGPDPDDRDEEVGDRDAERHPERQLDRPTGTLAHRETKTDHGRYGGEGGPVHAEELHRKKPRRAGRHGRLENLQPPAPQEKEPRARTVTRPDPRADPLPPRTFLARPYHPLPMIRSDSPAIQSADGTDLFHAFGGAQLPGHMFRGFLGSSRMRLKTLNCQPYFQHVEGPGGPAHLHISLYRGSLSSGVSSSEGAALSLFERDGVSTGQFIPIAGSFHRMDPSYSGA